MRPISCHSGNCNNDCLQHSLRDQLVEGVIDRETVQDLLKEQTLTLEKAINTCRAMEAAKKELRSRPGTTASALDTAVSESVNVVGLDSASSESVNAVSRYKQSKGKKRPVSTPVDSRSCRGCGQAEHPEGRRTSCPAFESLCSNCGKVGHYHTICRQKPKPRNPSSGHNKKLPPQTNIASVSLVLDKLVLREYVPPA